MGNLGFQETLLAAVITLIVFGPDRLPELARSAGNALARFRSETSKSVEGLQHAADLQDLDQELRGIRDDLTGIGSSVTGAFAGSHALPGTGADDAPPPRAPAAQPPPSVWGRDDQGRLGAHLSVDLMNDRP